MLLKAYITTHIAKSWSGLLQWAVGTLFATAIRSSHDVLSVPGDISSSDARSGSEVRAESVWANLPSPMGVFYTASNAHAAVVGRRKEPMFTKSGRRAADVGNVRCDGEQMFSGLDNFLAASITFRLPTLILCIKHALNLPFP